MNVLFFLKPKQEVEFIYDDETLRQVLEKMEYHRYSAIPLISRKDGTYIGTIMARDLLWFVKEQKEFSLRRAEDISIMQIRREHDNLPVDADAAMEDLIERIVNQNFVPVIDDSRIFIGIVTRKDVINYLVEKDKEKTAP